MAEEWHTPFHPISKMHIVGQRPGETASALRCLSYLINSFLTDKVLNIHWKDWCWSWNSKTLATWCEELTHLKRPWCWEISKAGGEGDDRGWDGWMTSPTQWTWVRVNSGSWWRRGMPGVLRSTGSQRVGYNWATEPNWIERLPNSHFENLSCRCYSFISPPNPAPT